MFFMIILILTFLSLSTTEASEYYKNKEHATWTEALSSCALALPMFREHLGQTVVRISNKVTDDLWVGYFKALTAFEYKGCIRNENFTKKFGSARLTIGLCFSACGRKQIVGISGRKCYCEDQMNFDADVRFTYCYKPRNSIANVHNTCDQNDCVSVYKVNNRVTKDQTLDMKDEMCLKFESVQYGRYSWTDCGQHNLAFCVFEEAHLTSRKTMSWRESANWCFAHEGNPLTDAELRLKTDSLSNSAWTSIICKYDNSLNSIRYGYLASEGPRTVLKFIDASTEKKMILCRNESPETSTIVSTQTGHVSTDNDLSTSTEKPPTSSVPKTKNATTSTDMSTNPRYKELNEEVADSLDLHVGAIVGASVGSVMIIIAVAVILLILKRRRNHQTVYTKSSNETTIQVSQEAQSYNHVADKTGNDHNQSRHKNYACTYEMSDKHVKESWIDDTTYDTSCSTKRDKYLESGNIYNKLDTDVNATYDHAYNKRKNGTGKAEDTYDTAEMDALATKADNKPDKHVDTDEDAYNHINGKQLKTCKTDNVYGISSYLGTGAREEGTSNGKDPHCEGDTYSHINNTSRKCSKPDNVYGVPNKLRTSSGETKHQEGDYDVSDKDIQVLDTDNEYSKLGTLS
ncbi:uncharacterized protein LOC128559862 isoform X2 [Mercenaria mercenaria]|uniref:uncharacterized protein LOC128559862 isoform X2 n=1 Tax=Mercenaria mercenaria TaxID=6596 RepID=UPI00234EA200|nr:uncharacterized protein LOC128559862 isoform X2 [Mercenaria mercenaria]